MQLADDRGEGALPSLGDRFALEDLGRLSAGNRRLMLPSQISEREPSLISGKAGRIDVT